MGWRVKNCVATRAFAPLHLFMGLVHVPHPRVRNRRAKNKARGNGAGELIGCFGLTEPDHGSSWYGDSCGG